MHPYRIPPGGTPDVLICSGLDPSGGAGFIADTRVVTTLGARPVGVVTALTVQNTTGVIAATALDPEQIRDQLEFLLSDVEVRAVKIGMIGSTEIARAITSALALTNAPVIWDPILYPSRGDVALVDSLFGETMSVLSPQVTLLTPNARELAFLANRPIRDLDAAIACATELARKFDLAVLVKGGHLGGPESIDAIVTRDHHELLRGPRLAGGGDVHGTGCALSSAIATHLARGATLSNACRDAKSFVADRIANAVQPGRGARAIV